MLQIQTNLLYNREFQCNYLKDKSWLQHCIVYYKRLSLACPAGGSSAVLYMTSHSGEKNDNLAFWFKSLFDLTC